jgi:SNARE domain/Syntaxin
MVVEFWMCVWLCVVVVVEFYLAFPYLVSHTCHFSFLLSPHVSPISWVSLDPNVYHLRTTVRLERSLSNCLPPLTQKPTTTYPPTDFFFYTCVFRYFFVLLFLYRTTYAKVAGKYQDVLTLESSVAELHQMFLDFALLTEQQGELLDQIEFQVKQAGDYVEEANLDVHEAIEIQKKIRKKQCWLILIAVVVCIVLLKVLGVF